MSENIKKRVIIVGSGLVGSLCACYMAQRGYQVEVYEKRGDIREGKEIRGRSINLALSHRGRNALRSVGLEEEILQAAIPMEGRLLHSISGELKSVLYDPSCNQCIFSVGRNHLNKKLLEATQKFSNIELFFEHLLTGCDFDDGTVSLLNLKTSEEIQRSADLIIGADGAYSKLRLSMQQVPQFQYSQQYIEHGYLELCIPAKRSHLMEPNHLHIWPRGTFMMIALPNQDSSWTVTLFMPFTNFENLTDKEGILNFFKDTFPDALDLLGREHIVETFLNTKPSQLISIKCSPYHVGSKFMIIGDAAHAVVPFYGQGMNAGFEDCFFLNDLLDKNKDNFELTIKEYSKLRLKNTHGISDLSMYNYLEMRDLVNTFGFRVRKSLDHFLYRIFPSSWIPLYNSVSFTTMEYQECIENRRWQDKVLRQVFMAIGIFLVVFIYLLSLKLIP
ncbi:kynurenine 3-monooxygenase isoform X1 [Diabrotica virgifera virgifera]|uniref:Kynurenine 3-monooxygenase n=5 Tax=Diabrotica virgifera virgifera TaxID=50390 RepID=A0ABM5KKD9_DIAVI|nr:kynurenine 3-monooxygenase isoform X1 [Diabrotica virgifera virgifera]